MMRWTGHPLVDAGVAALTAWSGRSRPEELTAGDLAAWADMSLRLYASKACDLSLNQLFTRNFPYLHPSTAPTERIARTRTLLYAWRDGQRGARPCAYCGSPALAERSHRDRVPLLEGRERMNFGPGGRAGLDVCGACLLALQALVFAAPVVRGRVTVVETPDDGLRLAVYERWVEAGVARAEGSLLTGAEPRVEGTPLTQAVEVLAAVFRAWDQPEGERRALWGGATVYAFTNSGQGPDVAITALGQPLVAWIRRAQSPRLRDAWRLCAAAGVGGPGTWGDDLALLPQGRERFWQRRLRPLERRLRMGVAATREGQGAGRGRRRLPLPTAATEEELAEADLGAFAESLLEGVVGVRAERMAAVRALAERLASDIAQDEDIRLYREMFQRNLRSYGEMRQILLRANARRLRRGREPVIGLDDFVLAFEEGPDEESAGDWRLAWDLALLGVAERLFRAGWIRTHAQVVASEEGLAEEGDEGDGGGESAEQADREEEGGV